MFNIKKLWQKLWWVGGSLKQPFLVMSKYMFTSRQILDTGRTAAPDEILLVQGTLWAIPWEYLGKAVNQRTVYRKKPTTSIFISSKRSQIYSRLLRLNTARGPDTSLVTVGPTKV